MKIKVFHGVSTIMVEAVDGTLTFWGTIFSLYKDNKNQYYVDNEEGRRNVNFFGKYDDQKEAIKKFREYMQEMIENTASTKLLEYFDVPLADCISQIKSYRKMGYLTINEGRNGIRYVRYKEDTNDAILDLKTGKIIEDVNFIKNQIC